MERPLFCRYLREYRGGEGGGQERHPWTAPVLAVADSQPAERVVGRPGLASDLRCSSATGRTRAIKVPTEHSLPTGTERRSRRRCFGRAAGPSRPSASSQPGLGGSESPRLWPDRARDRPADESDLERELTALVDQRKASMAESISTTFEHAKSEALAKVTPLELSNRDLKETGSDFR